MTYNQDSTNEQNEQQPKCTCCQNPMPVDVQETIHVGEYLFMCTCWNEECKAYGITVSSRRMPEYSADECQAAHYNLIVNVWKLVK